MKWAALIVALGSFAAADDKKPEPKRETVKAVLGVQFMYEEKRPPALVITARGAVPSAGWTKPQLKLRKTDKPPADGIYELQMTAIPPDGPAAQVVQEVKAMYYWVDLPTNLKGFKVSGVGEGVKTVMLDGGK